MKYKHLLDSDDIVSHQSIKKMKSEETLDMHKKKMEKERKMNRKGKQVAIQFITKTYEDEASGNDDF